MKIKPISRLWSVAYQYYYTCSLEVFLNRLDRNCRKYSYEYTVQSVDGACYTIDLLYHAGEGYIGHSFPPNFLIDITKEHGRLQASIVCSLNQVMTEWIVMCGLIGAVCLMLVPYFLFSNDYGIKAYLGLLTPGFMSIVGAILYRSMAKYYFRKVIPREDRSVRDTTV